VIEPEKDPFPSEKAPKRGVVAPWPSVEKYPVIIGSNLTFQYASSAMRSAMGGYRRNFVDLVCELLDHDPDTFNAINKRVLSIASARVELEAADPADATSVDVCERIKKLHKGIDGRVEAMARLQWGVIFGVAAEELLWRPQLDDNGSPTGKLELYGTLMIHSRRLGYPDPSKWKLCIWDQGPYDDSHSTIWGLGLSDIPNKFAVHSPSMRADYPTREGVGRILVTYMMLKRMVLRATAQDFERFINNRNNAIAMKVEVINDQKPFVTRDLTNTRIVNVKIGMPAGQSVLQSYVMQLRLISSGTDGTHHGSVHSNSNKHVHPASWHTESNKMRVGGR
jgi:hypothetical protein